MKLKRRILLVVAALWVALATIYSVRGSLVVLNPSISSAIDSEHSMFDNDDNSGMANLIQAHTILWSKNWHHHVTCPTVPSGFYDRGTGGNETNDHFVAYFQNCTNVLWLGIGNPKKNRDRGKPRPQRDDNDVQNFIKFVLPTMTRPFTLVTTDGDHSMPYAARSAQTLLDHPLCRGWYTQNYDAHIVHPKIHPVPIGFDLHTKWPGLWSHTDVSVNVQHMLELRRKGITTMRETITPLLVPYFKIRRNRKGAVNALNCIPSDDTSVPYVRLEHMGLDMLWQNYTRYRFGLSPPGAGLDTHRTWEMLFFGMIPIVLSSPMDPLFDGLPVLIVNDFGEMCAPGFFKAAWERLQPLWPAPDHVFTTNWWLRNVTYF